MRGLQAYPTQAPAQSQGGIMDSQTLGMLLNAYKQNQQPAGAGPGAYGTEYAPQFATSGDQGTGYGMGQPLVAGGASGQPMQAGNPLLDAMTRSRMQSGAGGY